MALGVVQALAGKVTYPPPTPPPVSCHVTHRPINWQYQHILLLYRLIPSARSSQE